MLISIEKRLVFLAMTKAASTSIEMALSPYCDIAFYGNSRVKHISYRRYSRFVVPYLDSLGYGDFETVCLIREPVDWLFSWYRYRGRPAVAGQPQSTAAISFDTFANAYLAGDPLTRGIGRQSKFVADKDGTPKVDHLFKYENLTEFTAYMETILGEKLPLGHLNSSPSTAMDIRPKTYDALKAYFAPEYALHRSAR